MTSRDRAAWWRLPIILPVTGFVLAFIALLAWGLSSPVGSSPDDDFHLASIWCGAGDREGVCEPADEAGERMLPVDVVTAACFAYKADESASCQGADFGAPSELLRATDRGNFANALYPPVFYFVMSAFVGPNVEASVVGMRIFASALFLAVVAGLFALLPVHRRSSLVLPLVLTVVPLGMFVIPSTNPSGWAVLSAGTLWIALVGYFETTGWRRFGLGAMAVLSTLIGAGARSDAAAFAGVAVGVALILSFRPTRRYFLSAILPLALLVIAVAFFFSGSQSAAASGGLNGLPPVTLEALKSLLIVNTLNVPQLWAGIFGLWGLGWLDTGLPAAVWFAGLGVFVAAVLTGLRSMSLRKGITLALAFFAIWAFPMVLLVQSQAFVGEYVQPRYVLPLIVIFAGIALYSADRPAADRVRTWSLTRLQIAVVIGALALANAVALHANIRRYVTGADVYTPNLDSSPEWWWPIAVSPMTVWGIGLVAFTGMLIAIAHPLWVRAGRAAAGLPAASTAA